MNRELCEFYRDRGYPQPVDEQGRAKGPYWGGFITGPECAIPDIPGLLEFLREKLPGSHEISLFTYTGEVPKRYIVTIYNAADQPRPVGIDPDPTTALALAGKAALEALDG